MKVIFMQRLCFLTILLLTACGINPTNPTSTATVETALGAAQSAVINLNIVNRDAVVQPLPPGSDTLFTANVGDVSTVNYMAESSEQAFIVLSDNPDNTSSATWQIHTNTMIPTAYVVDVIDGTLTGDLSTVNLPRFDIVASNSTVELQLPSSAFQLAIDAANSLFTIGIPTNANPQLSQLVSNGGLLTLNVASGVSFDGNISITAGGFTLRVPETTGVQIVVVSAENSEISLPDVPRIPAELGLYTTANFGTSDDQIILNAALSSAALRVVQE